MAITLVVETGAVVAGANAFVTLEECEAYHTIRGNADWVDTDDDEAKKAAIVSATFFLDHLKWKGLKTGLDNPLAWPRYGNDVSGWNGLLHPSSPYMGVIDEDGYDVGTATVPSKVKQACCEMALRYLQGADPEPDLDRGGRIRSQTIDVISTTYESGANPEPVYTVVRRLLRGLTQSKASGQLVLM